MNFACKRPIITLTFKKVSGENFIPLTRVLNELENEFFLLKALRYA